MLSSDEGMAALRLARGAVEHAVAKKPGPARDSAPVFSEKRGVFVTLTENGCLRGCIGLPYPVMPLGDAIEHAGMAAALEDPRFPPVRKEELRMIRIEVTVLTIPECLEGSPEESAGLGDRRKARAHHPGHGYERPPASPGGHRILLGCKNISRSYLHESGTLQRLLEVPACGSAHLRRPDLYRTCLKAQPFNLNTA